MDYVLFTSSPAPRAQRRAPFVARLRSRLGILLSTAAAIGLSNGALAASNINNNDTFQSSNLGGSVNPDFQGGVLQISSSGTITNNFAVENFTGNVIDAAGHVATMSGAFTGAGALLFNDSVGGGLVTLTNSGNTYTGSTTINSGAALALSGAGILSSSTDIVSNGTFDISGINTGASIISLDGAGTVTLGGKSLTLTLAAGSFTGTITGSGSLIVSGGAEILSGANLYTGGTTLNGGTLEVGAGATSGSILGDVADAGTLEFNRSDNIQFDGLISGTGKLTQLGAGILTLTANNSYTGATTISAGTLALTGNGSIAGSSGVAATGTFDISATSGASIKSLSGTGFVELGSQTLTITAGAGSFTGVIEGSGGLTVTGGTQLMGGNNTYTGPTSVTGGTLELGSTAIAYNITNSGTVAFDSSLPIAMSGVISGTGAITQIGTGVTTLSAPQSVTGPVTISAGTLALSGNGSLAAASGVAVASTLDFSAANSANLTSLSGSGNVLLGSNTLVLSNASGVFAGSISGSGGLTLAGGHETLSGSNGFTGATTISSGTLYLGGTASLIGSSKVIDNATLDISAVTNTAGLTSTSIVSLSGSGNVVLGTKTMIITGANDTFSGSISGAGGITLSGGSETLTGISSFSGNTDISGGILALAGSGSLAASGAIQDDGTFDISAVNSGSVSFTSLSGAGTVVLGNHNLILTAATTNFGGALSGPGSLTISGGTQSLSGTSNYTGGTTITAGTLQIGNGGTAGVIVGNVADNGTLAFDRADRLVFSGAISGTGAVTQIGNGTTVLAADTSYSGGTTITDGTLQLGNGAAAGSIQGDVTDNATLAFGRSDATVFGGGISGSGGVHVLSGTVTLTAANGDTGATVIDAASVLALSGSGSIAASNGVTDNGVLDISASTTAPQIGALSGAGAVTLGNQSLNIAKGTGNFSGALSGSGGLTINGGTQTLSGTNLYTGATLVNGGSLFVTGSIANSSGVTVNSGGTFGGSGTVSSITVNNGGSLALGASGAGTLQVAGTVALASAANTQVTMTSASMGKLHVSGAEALAGTLSIASADGTYFLGQKTAIVTADGGVTGTFTAQPIQSSGAQYSSTVSYDANDAYLEVDLAKLSPLLATNATRNESDAIGGNDAAIAAGHKLPSTFENLGGVSSSTLTTDAANFASQIGAQAAETGQSLFTPFMDAIFDHIADNQRNGAPPWQQKPPGKDFLGIRLCRIDLVLGPTRHQRDREIPVQSARPRRRRRLDGVAQTQAGRGPLRRFDIVPSGGQIRRRPYRRLPGGSLWLDAVLVAPVRLICRRLGG